MGLQPPYPHVIQPPSAARDGAYSAFSAPYPVAHPPSMPEARRVDERRFIDRESPAARDARFLAPLPPVPPPEPRVAQLESPPPQRSPAVTQTTIPLESAGTSTERDAPPSRAQPSTSRTSANTRRASTNVVIACKQWCVISLLRHRRVAHVHARLAASPPPLMNTRLPPQPPAQDQVRLDTALVPQLVRSPSPSYPSSRRILPALMASYSV